MARTSFLRVDYREMAGKTTRRCLHAPCIERHMLTTCSEGAPSDKPSVTTASNLERLCHLPTTISALHHRLSPILTPRALVLRTKGARRSALGMQAARKHSGAGEARCLDSKERKPRALQGGTAIMATSRQHVREPVLTRTERDFEGGGLTIDTS